MWQKSDTGSVPGISGNVDLDECYQDYPALIQKAGLNNFQKFEPETKEKKQIRISIDNKTYFGQVEEE